MSALLHAPECRLVAVDPGLRGCGVALFKGGTLLRAAYVKNNAEGRGYNAHVGAANAVRLWLYPTPMIDELVVEFPRVYPGSAQQKGDLNDLLDVAGVGAAVSTAIRMFDMPIDSRADHVFPSDWKGNVPKETMTERIRRSVEHVFPSDWKGNVPKETMTERIRRSLTDEERKRIEKCPASLMHNTLDACGIGLYKLGRLNKKVYPHAD